MNVTLPRGANLMLDFQLPFSDPPASSVTLNMNGEELLFTHDGEPVASFTRVTDPDNLKLMHFNGHWWIRFEAATYDFLPDGVNGYEFTVIDLSDELLMIETGTVTVNA